MPVVSNTSPILNLAIIGRLNLLHEQFEDVAISEGVQEDLRSDEGLPGCEAIRKALRGFNKSTVFLSVAVVGGDFADYAC